MPWVASEGPAGCSQGSSEAIPFFFFFFSALELIYKTGSRPGDFNVAQVLALEEET